MKNISEYVRSINISQYISLFGSVFDRSKREQVPMELWPLQKEMLDNVDRDMKNGYQLHFIPKARQLGVTEMFSERAIKDCIGYRGFQVSIVSKKQEDAEYLLKHRILPKIAFLKKRARQLESALGLQGRLQFPEIEKVTLQRVELSNGSVIRAYPASDTAGASTSVDGVILDEAGGFDLQNNASFEELYKNIQPTMEKAGELGWMAIIGTSEPGTFFNEKIKKISTKGSRTEKVYFLPWWTDVNRDADWYQDKIDSLGPLHARLQYPSDLKDFFSVKEGLVLPQFDQEVGGRHIQEFAPNWNNQIWFGYDHGTIHAAALLIGLYNQFEDKFYIVDERFWWNEEVAVIGPDTKKCLDQMPKPPRRMIADTAIHKNVGIKSIADHFRDFGVKWGKSNKYDEAGGLALLQTRLTQNKIVIHPRCVNLIEQLSTWKWNKKGTEPEDANNDGPDVLRYFCTDVVKGHKHVKEQEVRKPGRLTDAAKWKDMGKSAGARGLDHVDNPEFSGDYRRSYQMM